MNTTDDQNLPPGTSPRYYPGDLSVRLLAPETATNGEIPPSPIEISVQPHVTDDMLQLSGTVNATLPGTIDYSVTMYAIWSRSSSFLSTEQELREHIRDRGIRELATVLNYELQSLGRKYALPHPVIDDAELEKFDAMVMKDSLGQGHTDLG